MKGVYILVISLGRDTRIRIGALGNISFRKGFYAYSGSAMGGLEQRIGRHLRKTKKLHWHIDYFLKKAEVRSILIKETELKSDECKAAGMLVKERSFPVEGFGCSDCKCKSHLFHFKRTPRINFEDYRLLKL